MGFINQLITGGNWGAPHCIYTHMLHIWYIYLHLGDFLRANVGKYASTMEHMGYIYNIDIYIIYNIYIYNIDIYIIYIHHIFSKKDLSDPSGRKRGSPGSFASRFFAQKIARSR